MAEFVGVQLAPTIPVGVPRSDKRQSQFVGEVAVRIEVGRDIVVLGDYVVVGNRLRDPPSFVDRARISRHDVSVPVDFHIHCEDAELYEDGGHDVEGRCLIAILEDKVHCELFVGNSLE